MIVGRVNIADIIQNFHLPVFPSQMGKGALVLAFLFRSVIGLYALALAHRLFIRIVKMMSRSMISDCSEICGDRSIPAAERLSAINELRNYGPFAESAIEPLVKLQADNSHNIRKF